MTDGSSDEYHGAETFHSRHFDDTVEIWCPDLDETKVVLGEEYVRHCPMCGEGLSDDEDDDIEMVEALTEIPGYDNAEEDDHD